MILPVRVVWNSTNLPSFPLMYSPRITKPQTDVSQGKDRTVPAIPVSREDTMEFTESDQIDIDSELQFHQEYQQWRQEQEEHDEALENYLIALLNYYGNQRCG